MKINFDRICRLAGVESKGERRTRLTEGVSEEFKMEMEERDQEEGVYEYDEAQAHDLEEYDEGQDHDLEEYDETAAYEGHDPDHTNEMEERLDEMVEVDPKVLMEEIRRAKKLKVLRENKRRKNSKKKQRLQENHLKRVIRSEIQNILKEMDNADDSDSEWLYGNKKPKNSKKGYTSHGRLMPGIGFKKSW